MYVHLWLYVRVCVNVRMRVAIPSLPPPPSTNVPYMCTKHFDKIIKKRNKYAGLSNFFPEDTCDFLYTINTWIFIKSNSFSSPLLKGTLASSLTLLPKCMYIFLATVIFYSRTFGILTILYSIMCETNASLPLTGSEA